MTEKQVLLIKYSWSYVAGQLDRLTNMVERQLIRQSPPSKLLAAALENRKALPHLIESIHRIVVFLPDLSDMKREVAATLREYRDFDVSEEQFEDAVVAFVTALEKKLHDAYTRDIGEAWVFLFATIKHEALSMKDSRLPRIVKQTIL